MLYSWQKLYFVSEGQSYYREIRVAKGVFSTMPRACSQTCFPLEIIPLEMITKSRSNYTKLLEAIDSGLKGGD